MQPLLVFVAFLQAAQLPPVRDPAFARDGRLVVSIEGDLWMRDAAGKDWRRLTSGVAWDREPAWAPDGSAVVFVSDRGGNIDLWRLPVSTAGAAGEATRLTTDPAPDLEPSVAASGAVVFVRGRGSAARLWMRDASGGEHRLTRTEEQERWPAVSPDGQRVAWVQVGENSRRLLVRAIAGDRDSTVVADRAPESPTWSPDGRRLAFFSATPRAAIYVTPTDGHYVNLVSDERAVPVWSPDGATIVLGQHAPDEPGYNGDPDRVGDRIAYEDFQDSGLLQRIDAPVAPDESPAALPVSVTLDRGARNVEAFDRFWERMDRVYYSTPAAADRHAKWLAMKDAWRARARSAGDDEALQGVMHAMLRDRPVLRAEASGRAAVSSANPVATAAGLEMLRRGGNVVDAAVAVSFALAVVEPDASGPGGYGQMLVYKAGMQQPALIEFMARVPEEAGLSNTSFLRNGRYPSDGPVLAMVPGTVAGMYSAWKQYGSGRLPWADLLAPAIRAARDGYEVSDGLATTLWRERDGFMKYPASRALFFRDGKPVTAGDTIRNPDLAWTLEHIAKGGADGFYRGEVAQRLVDDLRSHGNAVQMTDMARYFAADRTPVSGTYRGLTVYSSAPPVSGGATLVAQLNLLEQVPAPKLYTDDAATLHAMIAAWQLVPSSRGRIADPSLWPVNIEPITNKDTARARWKCFDPSHALTPASLRGDPLACESPPRASASRPRSRGTAGRVRRADPRRRRRLPVERHDRIRRGRRRRQRGRRYADTRHVGRWLLRLARTRIPVQRQADLVRHRPERLRRAPAVRQARQHACADDRLSRERNGTEADYCRGRGGKRVDHKRGLRDPRRHGGLRFEPATRPGAAPLPARTTRWIRRSRRRRRREAVRDPGRGRHGAGCHAAAPRHGLPLQHDFTHRRAAHGIRRRGVDRRRQGHGWSRPATIGRGRRDTAGLTRRYPARQLARSTT